MALVTCATVVEKGIVLAGGSGTRLFPVTMATSKQLMPIYNKPMVYYPLSVLMLAGIREVIVVTTPHEQQAFQRLLGNGSQWGMTLHFEVQPKPEGLAQSFLVAQRHIESQPCALVLGDNVFYGRGLSQLLRSAAALKSGAVVFAYPVDRPQEYGVVAFDDAGRAVSLEEKPKEPKSKFAVTGLYFYDSQVLSLARGLKPSARGELEITDLNRVYMEQGGLKVEVMGRGFAWLDTGTHRSMLQASNFVEAVESRQGLMISCPEEIALRSGWIDAEQVLKIAAPMAKNEYGQYLMGLVAEF